MKPGNTLHSGRSGALFVAFVFSLILGGSGLCTWAANGGRGRPAGNPQRASRGVPLNTVPLDEMPLQRGSLQDAVAGIQQSQAAYRLAKAGGASTQANPAPAPTAPQFFDLTTNPKPPIIGPSTKSKEIHPAWAWDQRHIYFASNNVDPIDNYGATAPTANARFHIYKMTSDGTFIEQITGVTLPDEAAGEQRFPALNHSLTKMAYVHRPTPADPFELYVLDFLTGQRTQLTGVQVLNNPLNSQIVNVEHPSFSATDNLLTFAARNQTVTGDVRNVYTINLISRVVTKLTSGNPANGVECIDPVYHPDANAAGVGRITFAANTGNPNNGVAINFATGDLNYVANPLQDLNGDKKIDEVDHNLFTVSDLGPSQANPVVQLTTAAADDVEPAYEQSDYPPGSNPPTGTFNNWLAWSSKGRQANANTAPGITYDIYFNNGSAEAASQPIRLFTPDTNAGAVPLNKSDERYPTWSSGLPPQNPIDRIAFQSNRQQNLADPSKPTVSTTDTDIWGAEVTDITPPTLFSIGDSGFSYIKAGVQPGETLHISNAPLPNAGRRIGQPGEPFYFYANVKDLQYGVESVWLQIKDPDGPSTDSRGVNHKLYGLGQYPFTPLFGGIPDETNNGFPVRFHGPPIRVEDHWVHFKWETDYAGIGVSDYQYYSGPVRFDWATNKDGLFGTNARFATFDPGVDDSVRWSGNQISPFWVPGGSSPWSPQAIPNRPPTDGAGNPRWLRLHDDGVSPDQVAGDDIYSASWVAPADPSDFYVDLIAYDKAFNPSQPSQQQNWIIFDNIWGFSTQAFISRNPVLFVDDNGAGQKWPRGLKGNFRPFPQFRFGTESDIADRPDAFLPEEIRGSDTNNTLAPWSVAPINDPASSPLFTAPSFGSLTYPFLAGNSTPYDFISWARGVPLRAYKYDMWRILAKGPLPETVLNDYVPTTDLQPGDILDTPSKRIKRPVPRRAVLWNAPYTGDIFLGQGSILDQQTQALLTKYRSRAGRLFVAGGDILWALTVNGTVQQQFVQTVLGSDFGQDETYGNFEPFQNGPLGLAITRDAANRAFDPFGTPPYWGPFYDPDPIGTATSWQFEAGTTNPAGDGNADETSANEGTPFRTQDQLIPRAGWEMIFQDRMVANADAATQSKTVFLSASLASFGRRYLAMDNALPLDCMNYRAKISHATFCWMFSADLVGTVRSLDGSAPVVGAFVQAFQGGQLVGSAFSDTDGNYIIRGLPIGGWNIQVSNPGFVAFNKAVSSAAHGLDQSRLDVFLTTAQPGSISGKVVDKFGQPVPGVTVLAVLQASPLFTGQRNFSAVTDANGNYTIAAVPVASGPVGVGPTYTVSVDTTTLPPDFANPQPPNYTGVIVNPAQDTTGIDFTLEGQPSDLTVTVIGLKPDGTDGPPVSGADVTLQDATGAIIPGFTGVSNAQGQVVFKKVPAGPVTVSAFKFGFQEGTAAVNIPQQKTVTVRLAAALKRDLFGLAVRAVDGKPVVSADLNPAVTLTLLRSTGIPTPLQTNVFAPPKDVPGGTGQYNYKFLNAQEGRFIVALRNHPRYLDAQVTVDITSTLPNVAPPLQLLGRDGILTGSVKEQVSGGTAGAGIGGATVTITSTTTNPPTVVATVTTGPDGKWTTTTPIKSDVYSVTAAKFGFATVTKQDVFVAGDTDAGTILLPRGPRGQLFGLVRRAADKAPRDGVKVEFWTTAASGVGVQKITETTSFLPTVPGPDGQPLNYRAGQTATSSEFLPEGDYTVRVNDPRFAAVTKSAHVTGGQASRVDIDLVPLSGTLEGTVREDQGNGSAGAPIPGATVAISRNGTRVANLTTDANGHYKTTTTLTPTQYTITVSKFGYLTANKDVFIEGNTTAPDILLQKVPPKTLRGAVVSSIDSNVLIGGVKVELLPSNGIGPAVASTTTTNTGSGNPLANFTLTGLAPGTYLVRATKAGWRTPSTLPSITLDPNQTGSSFIQITLDPDHVFGKGLLMISLPDDFGGQDAASVLDQPASTFRSAYWLTGSRTYAIYPDRQAAEFRLGKGLFVRFNNRVAFTKSGTPAPNAPFAIPVQAGWNMIGSVRRVPIEWLRVKVQTADGRTRTMQEAYDAGIIQNGIFGYVDGYSQSNFLQPFAGYFVRAFQACTLIVPVNNTVGSITPAMREKVARMPAPTPEQVAREVAAAGLGPAPAPARPRRPESFWQKLFRLPLFTPAYSLLNAVQHWPRQNPAG